MVYRKVLFACVFVLVAFVAHSQGAEVVNIGGPRYLVKSSKVPESLTSSRSVVVIEIPEKQQGRFTVRGDWKKLAEEVHKSFRNIGIDGVWYLYGDDLNAGPEVKNAYQKIFSSRDVQNLIYIKRTGDEYNASYSLKIIPLNEDGEILPGQLSWMEQSNSLSTLFLRLGRQVLRQELERTNFLIPEKPEYLEDLAVFAGNRLENFPSRLKSLPLAVVAFQKLSTENVNDDEMLQRIREYNRNVDQKNEELESILSLYPFQYRLVNEVENEALYQKGYQYVLFPLCSTGKTVKKMLNYPTNLAETDYMVSVYSAEGKQELVQVPVGANICKFYVKQTIVKDIHTGDVWDAEPSWQESLRNFILHMRVAFRLPLDG